MVLLRLHIQLLWEENGFLPSSKPLWLQGKSPITMSNNGVPQKIIDITALYKLT